MSMWGVNVPPSERHAVEAKKKEKLKNKEDKEEQISACMVCDPLAEQTGQKMSKERKQTPDKQKLSASNITGKELQKLREESVKTVQEFADLLNVTPATIYRWEKLSIPLNLYAHSRQALEEYLAIL